MPTDFETFLATFCIWDFHDKCSSSITPKKRTSFTRSISMSLIENCKSSFCLFFCCCCCFKYNKIWFFYVNRKLSLKPVWWFLQFVVHIFHRRLIWVVTRKKMLVSSAKSMKSKAFDTLQKSLMYNKNNNGPNIDPWGTPHLKYLEEEL